VGPSAVEPHRTLRPPGAVPHYVRRARLHDLLDDAVGGPLTLVAAPAGAGKTSLLAGWVAETALPAAWLTLDEGDRDPARLWRRVAAALDPLAPGCGAGVLVTGPTSETVPTAEALLTDLDGRVGPDAVLVIDDAHLVDDDDLLVGSLARFLQDLPPWLRAVVATRRDPALPLDRLRAQGRLREVRFGELRFTPEEARTLLARLAPDLDAGLLDRVVARAGGWAAALQLAALAARSARASNAAFAPSVDDRDLVEDYVLHELLGGEDPGLVAALADVAVVDGVDPGLARALTGRADAGDLLRRAEARGLLVTRRPGRVSFEVHALVRDALVARAAAQEPERLAERHVRAARWFEGAGEVVTALEHLLAAGRPRDALRLLAASHAELYDTGREPTVLATIAAIPPEVADADLPAMLEYAWCHLLVDRRRFVELVEKLTWWADTPKTDPTIRPRVTMLQSVRATISGRWGDGGMLATQALTTMGDGWWRDPLGRFGWNMVARDVALFERWDPDADEVRQGELALGREPERRLAFEGTRALGEALAGRPVDALRIAAAVRHAADVAHLTILRLELGVAEAVAHREIGDRARALPELETLAGAPAGALPYCRVLAAAELVQARLDAGDVAAARDQLGRTEALVDAESLGPDARNWLARAGARVALAEGAVREARRWSDQIDDPFWRPVTAARIDLAVGSPLDATVALRAAAARCARHGVVRSLLLARAVERRDEALRLVAAAAERAAGLGLVQTVAAEGPDVVQLVERAAHRVPESWIDRLRRAEVPTPGRAMPAAGDPVVTLTDRERDVLRLLASRLTVREIASELYVSPNTLKFHLKTIYRKLAVGSRAEAAEVARRMTAVPPR
jgi:LuxR family maltose regulon positive regulatory protein